MPTPSQNYQASINGVLMGTNTDFLFGSRGIQGLGNPDAKTADIDLDQQDGTYAAPDYLQPRTLLLHLEIVATTASAGFNALKALKIAWLPTLVDAQLHVQLPGWGHIYYLGRPRSLEDDCTNAQQGCITCIAEFLATDPHAHNA